MSHQYRVRTADDIYFVTFTIVDWVDVFTRPAYKQLIIESLTYCQLQKGLVIYGYCLMTNHLHLLVSAREPASLPDIIRDFKKHTNKQIIKLMNEEHESRRDWILYRFSYNAKYNSRVQDYKVWQDGYHGIACSYPDILMQKLEYIHQNPVKAEIVAEPAHYLYSSAIDYEGKKGLLEITLLETSFFFSTI